MLLRIQWFSECNDSPNLLIFRFSKILNNILAVNLNGPIFIPDGINAMAAWHNIPGQLRTASDVQYVRAPYITHVPLQTQPPHPGSPSPGCQAGTSTRIQEETQIT